MGQPRLAHRARAPGTSPASLDVSAAGEASASLAAASRSGALHVTKECSQYTGAAGSFCTITSSNIKGIEVGSTVIYASAAGATSLDPPGPGNNLAFGHVTLNFLTGTGVATFSGGTGKFKHFTARAAVSYLGGPNWAWDGTYGFND